MSRTVGVIGGMGPAATVDFMARLLAKTPAAGDADHLRLLVDSNPHVPNRNRALAGTGPSPASVLTAMAQGLERQGADLLVMPCNAAHAFAGAIRTSVAIPFLSMIDVAAARLRAACPGKAVGLLAADGALAAGLYQQALGDPILPDAAEQAQLMDAIYAIKAGVREAAATTIQSVAQHLAAAGAEVLLIACTELPLALSPDLLPLPVIDALDALVDETIAVARA